LLHAERGAAGPPRVETDGREVMVVSRNASNAKVRSLQWQGSMRAGGGMRPLRRRRKSVAQEAAKAIEPEHGTVEGYGGQLSVYCARCHRWQVVEVDPQLALHLHEVMEHER